ncbi:integrase catalytic domain-containing protein [Trichonephila clavipes]|nr:integrase catalytic domain-containing protein [Trichonephila clavipes]
MRIVFDASSHEDGQPSLNDCIWSGENLNPNIFHLIISFRLNTIAITADIERAFLQISLRDEDRDAVRFLFPDIRSNQTDPYKFQVYRFKRVMFGVNVSPFLLSATIKHHIENYREQYPAATKMLDTCLYVDDVISGADDISQALKMSKDAETIMKNASMKLRKWNSNDQTLMRTWEREGLETHPRHPDDSSKIPSSKVLGIPWDVVHDYFTIDVKGLLQLDTSKTITKRIVLQSAGKIYDPVGFLSPYTIRLKCLLQELWLRKLSWDDELPPDIHAVWSQWWLELPFLSELKIPRKILDSSGDSSEVQIHTFSDASQKAYGAAAFLRVKHKDRVSVDLVTSKSRVAPLKRLSLPRLELMGALLAARLAKEVKKILDQKVREIQSLTDPNSWFHCSGKDNPADLLTRGISVDALTNNSKWWNGSSFLRQIDFQTKGLDEAIPERVYLTEMRKNSNPKEDISLTLTVTENNFLDNIIDISNNYVKLIRVEVSHAENWLIHSLHEREFYEEMRKLLAGEPIPMKSKLTPLNVFLDESNIIRSTRRVADQVDRSDCAVRNCSEQWTREGTHARKTGSGATRKTTRREDRRIVRQELVNPTVTRSTIRAAEGVAIVPQTISRHLAEANLNSKRPFHALPLTPEHRQLRLHWCQARSMWNVTDWQKVRFSDESRFVLGTDDIRVRVWRHPGERYNSSHTVLRHTARTAGVMVWGP